MGVPKFSILGLLQLWGTIILCADFQLRWGLKDSRLLVVGSQTTNLTPDFSFGYNLCFQSPNWSCEPILDNYISISFQWYKKIFNPLGFDLCNRSLKIQKSIGTPNSQSGSSLGSVRVHSLTFSFTPGLLSWPATLQALALVASPRLGLRYYWSWYDRFYVTF